MPVRRIRQITNQTQLMEQRFPEEIEAQAEKLLQDLSAVVQDGEELLKAGVQNLGERGRAARARVADALEAARQARQKFQAQVLVGARSADRAIREHPYQAIGFALGAGMLVGVLLNRR